MPFKLKYACKPKFALTTIIKTTNLIELTKNSACNFVINYKGIFKEA
jgi:hypothetical protein